MKPMCMATEHWTDEILWGKCRKCGGEIAVRKADIPALARDIERNEIDRDADFHDCKNDEFGNGACPHPSHPMDLLNHDEPEHERELEPLIEEENAVSDLENYLIAH